MSRERMVRPWFLHLADSSPLGLVGTGVALALVWIACDAFISIWVPRLEISSISGFREIYFGGIFAYTISAAAWVNQGALHCLDSLRPAPIDPVSGYDRAALQLRHAPRIALVLAHLAGVVLGVFLAANGPVSGGVLREQEFSPSIVVWLLQGAVLWGVVAPVLYLGVRTMQIFRRLGQSGVEVDVLELDALVPFSRIGLLLAASLLGASVFPVLMVILHRDAGTALWFIALLFGPTWILAVAAMVVPSSGIHAAIRDAKRQEQDRISLAIRGDRRAMAGSPIAHEAESLSVVELLAYRDRITHLREWPFDARVLGQFGLTMLIPVASWVAGALVERGIDRVMGE